MKKIIQKNTHFIFLIVALSAISFSSCKKKDEQPTPGTGGNTTQTGILMFHLHTYLDINEVDAYNIVYTTDLGRQVSLSIAQLYVSNIKLVKLDGSIYDVPRTKILKVLETETYLIGDVPVGNYKSIRFSIGLDSIANQTNPSTSPDSAILKHSEMWLGGTAQPEGYVFVNVQGTIDTTADLSGVMRPFTYKIGTNAHYKQIVMPDKNYTVVPNQTQFVHIIVDYNKLFNGIRLNQSSNLSVSNISDNATIIGNKIANNVPAMFSYEE